MFLYLCFHLKSSQQNPFSNVQGLDDVAIERKVFKVRMRFKHRPAICYRGMLYDLFKYLFLLFIQEQKQIKHTKNSTKCQPIRRTSRGLVITITPTRTITTIVIWLINGKTCPADPTCQEVLFQVTFLFNFGYSRGQEQSRKNPPDSCINFSLMAISSHLTKLKIRGKNTSPMPGWR